MLFPGSISNFKSLLKCHKPTGNRPYDFCKLARFLRTFKNDSIVECIRLSKWTGILASIVNCTVSGILKNLIFQMLGNMDFRAYT